MPTEENQPMPMTTVLVTTVRMSNGTTLAAWWDGGREIRLHVDGGGGPAPVQTWPIWNEAWDCPLIEPTRDSFERFLRGRLAEPGMLAELHRSHRS